MKNIISILVFIVISSCGYHLRSNNILAENYPKIKMTMKGQSLLKRPLINALLSSGIELTDEVDQLTSELIITKDVLRKVVQSIGANNQVQEYRLEYDVELTIDEIKIKAIHLEKDYSFDIQQIGGGQQEEITLRKQMADDMAWAIIRQINASKTQSAH